MTRQLQAVVAPAERTPLPPGAVIEYCCERAEVVFDPGGEGRLTVKVDGMQDRWWWSFDGASCTLVSLPIPESEG